MIHLLLGQKQKFQTDGEKLLVHVLHRYSLFTNLYRRDYCYFTKPPSKAKDRRSMMLESRKRLEVNWLQEPGPVIGFGWEACELLTGRGKTKLAVTTGTKWQYINDNTRLVWIARDPAGALFNPNLTVDIASVIVAACKDSKIQTKVNKEEPPFNWNAYL